MNRNAKDFLEGKWIYVPNHYCEHREVLGITGSQPLVVIGVNPSTAEPNHLDPTLKSVERIAKTNGYDAFLMFNLYPQRATNPNDMDATCNEKYRKLNAAVFEKILREISNPVVWCAWGTLIEKRDYLKECLKDFVSVGKKFEATWKCAGPISIKGHPHHPLYLKSSETLRLFQINEYLA